MLLHMALGDAYGAPFEFVKHAGMPANNTTTFYAHPSLSIGGGRYTDDTQMALAIAEEMLSGKIASSLSLADRFVECFKRDERKGYGAKFYEILQEAEDGADLFALLRPDSTRSGACMRAGPAGLFGSLEQVFSFADLQASITHNTDEGRLAARGIAAMTHYFAYQIGDRIDLTEWLMEVVPGTAWNEPWRQWTKVEAIDCARASVTAIMDGISMRDVLKRSIDVGGDVDTVAAMAMFAASLAPDLEDDLPLELLAGLENGTYGRDYLAAMDVRLVEFARLQGAKL